MPKKTPPKPKPLYRRKPPRRMTRDESRETRASKPRTPDAGTHAPSTLDSRPSSAFLPHAHPIASAHFTLREDGSIGTPASGTARSKQTPIAVLEAGAPIPSTLNPQPSTQAAPRLAFSSETPFIRLYHGNCLELLDAIAAKYPDGRFDAIFADPPYFLSNGGITCHAGKMVKVDKGDWDVSRGPELNHEFNTEWLRRCQRVLKPNGTIWVTGTHHVIFSIGYALQQLGFKILNDIAWEKPNPPPNLSCRYFTHSTETVLWAAKNEKSKHVFNYSAMKAVTGKQMKTVWRDIAAGGEEIEDSSWKIGKSPTPNSELPTPKHPSAISHLPSPASPAQETDSTLESIWTLAAPGNDEKKMGRHPTQKPVALVERCLLASTNEGDLVLDPFLGNGTTAVASLRLKRGCVGIELDLHHVEIAARRADREIIEIWLRHFRVRMEITVIGRAGSPLPAAPTYANERRARSDAPYHDFPRPQTPDARPQNDLAIFPDSINGSRDMADVPEIQTERIFHETKFVFLSCAQVERGAVVHTTVDVSLQEAWAKTPTGKKRETTHVVRCETEIFRVAARREV